MARTVWPFAILTIAALAAAPAAAPRDTPQTACALVTRDEAAAAVGARVSDGELTAVPPAGGMEVSACLFRGGGMDELKVTVYRFAAAAKQSLDVYRARCGAKEAAAGLGDVACWYSARHHELQVLKGTTLVVFQLDRGGSTTEPLLAVAKLAVPRLR